MEQQRGTIMIPVVVSGPKKERDSLMETLRIRGLRVSDAESFAEGDERTYPVVVRVILKSARYEPAEVHDDVHQMVEDCEGGQTTIRVYYGKPETLRACASAFHKSLKSDDRRNLPPTVFAVMPVAVSIIVATVNMLTQVLDAQQKFAFRCEEVWRQYWIPRAGLW